MGTYDTIIATVTCPCCKNTYLHEDIQTKQTKCMMSEIFQGDNTQTLEKHRSGLDNAFYNIRDAQFSCHTDCMSCESEMEIICEIRNHIMIGVVAVKTGSRNPCHNPMVMDLNSHAKYAVENQLLRK